MGLGSALLDLLYPPRCAACGDRLAGVAEEPFCRLCGDAVDPVPAGCRRCGHPGPDDPCGACLAAPPSFARLRAPALYGGPLADAVHALKYRDRPALARPLGAWLARALGPPPAGACL
ncbi:MAG TPA: double zinc ribbon domain-containing protein, partial [Anaeromyxobacteraceae bacterium]|nr:double zinc ribbon domain-containing protein [Anaeromyxobacteraceae bacterium]